MCPPPLTAPLCRRPAAPTGTIEHRRDNEQIPTRARSCRAHYTSFADDASATLLVVLLQLGGTRRAFTGTVVDPSGAAVPVGNGTEDFDSAAASGMRRCNRSSVELDGLARDSETERPIQHMR